MERYHATSALSLTTRHAAWAERLDFKRFIFGRAVGRVLINAGIGRISALGANRTRRDGGNDVNDTGPEKWAIPSRWRTLRPAIARASPLSFRFKQNSAYDISTPASALLS